MPEISEVRIIADYINKAATDRSYYNIRKSAISKVKMAIITPFETFKIKAETRGKELKIILISKEGKTKTIVCGLGMSGTFDTCGTGSEPHHMHLMFDSMDNTTLGLVDVRRFAKWKWGDWNFGRGPDPMLDNDNFINNVWKNINNKHFNKTISEILMEQTYFNGIGNAIRAEVLFRADQNPFENAKAAIENNPMILDLCKLIPIELYQNGGYPSTNWINPFQPDNISYDNILCYKKEGSASTTDKTGRTLWFNKKWIINCPYPV